MNYSDTSGRQAVAEELPEVPSPDNAGQVETANMDSKLDATLPYVLEDVDVPERPSRQKRRPAYIKDYDISGGKRK